jgi:hypothetical protein
MSKLRFTGKYYDYVQVINRKVVPVKVPIYEHVGPYITGYYGCSCHPFNSWKECEMAHKRKFRIGDIVKHRCNGVQGEITQINGQGFYYVSTLGQLHAARLEPVKGQLKLF